jgi:hypothetical protein
MEAKRLEAVAHEKTLRALVGLGFERRVQRLRWKRCASVA